MLLFNLTEMGAREPVGKTNQCWPEPSMNECDLATYDAANKNIIVVSHRTGQCEYLFALGVGPPTSLERSLRHRLCQGGNRPSTRLQHDTVFSNKFDGLVGGHLWALLAHLLGGLALLAGFYSRWAVALLVLVCLGTAFGVHLPAGDQDNMIHF
jgi:uncharacterized membrane protein YphA (DoxX/SURF4 family)